MNLFPRIPASLSKSMLAAIDSKFSALRSLALAGACGACGAGVSQGAVTHTIPAGYDNHPMLTPVWYGVGPVAESGWVWSANTSSFYSYSAGWDLEGNGNWYGLTHAAVNSYSGTMTFTFDSDVASVLAFVNYAPTYGTPTMSIYDSSNNLLESSSVSIATSGLTNAGEDWGFARTEGDIRSITFSDSYIVAANIRTTSARTFTATPEPSSSALLGLGGIALMLRRRR